MVRKLLSTVGVLVAVVSVTFSSSEAQARRCCRNHHRNRCCQQNGNSGCGQQNGNCGCQQAGSYAPAMACCGQQSYAPTTACCGQQSSSGTVQSAGYGPQRTYDAPVSAGGAIQAAPVATAPAPAPGN
jgi:hypothetical protein